MSAGDEEPYRCAEGVRSVLCAPLDCYGVTTTRRPAADISSVTCPRCLALLARPAAENPSIVLGAD